MPIIQTYLANCAPRGVAVAVQDAAVAVLFVVRVTGFVVLAQAQHVH